MRSIVVGLGLAATVLVSACGSETMSAGSQPDDVVATAPGDAGSGDDPGSASTSGLLADTTGNAPFYLEAASVRVAESYPVQLFLDVTGSAPTPCHQVAYRIDGSAEKITVAITTSSSGEPCAQVLAPHAFAIPLGPSDLPVVVEVNDAEFVTTVRP